MNAMPGLSFEPKPLMSERKVSMLGALLVVIGPMSMALYTPAMPEIARAFAAEPATVKMTLALYFGGFAFAQLIAGPLSDALGRRPVTIAFMAIYLAASLAALAAPSIDWLLAARLAQGIGASAGVANSRAIVRDLFTHAQSARIMNLIGIMLAIGPAAAPTIGGFVMAVAGWREIFLVMALLGVTIIAAAIFVLKETVTPDRSRLQPRALFSSYRRLAVNPLFMTGSLTIAFSVGSIYAQATFLPFILMDRVGLTPAQFGLAMLAQSGSYFLSSLLLRRLMRYRPAEHFVGPGLLFVALGCIGIATLALHQPGFFSVMGPVAFNAFGIAFIVPAMSTAVLAPFAREAGAASALMGFLQMGLGLAFGAAGAVLGDPVIAMALFIPLMGACAILSWLAWRRQMATAERVVSP